MHTTLPFLAFLPHGLDFFWIFVLFVLLFGAKKLPDLARGLGKSLGEFKKAKDEFDREVKSSISDAPAVPPAPLPPAVPPTTTSISSGPTTHEIKNVSPGQHPAA